MNASPSYPCGRCEGKGRIAHFSHVMNGVCMKCGGSGVQKSKPRASRIKFAVFLRNTETGKADRIWTMSGRSSAEAIRAAEHYFADASSGFRDVYTLEGAIAIRTDELAEGCEHLPSEVQS